MAEDELKLRISDILQQSPSGLENKKLILALKDVEPSTVVQAINRLIAEKRIELRQKGSDFFYIWQDPNATQDSKAALLGDDIEKAVYEMVKGSGNKGIWMRDIREKCNLTLPMMKKAIKNLETKKIIKSVKSVSNARQKFYMLYDVEPDQSLTGGIFYTGHEHDTEFVDILNQHCCHFLKEKSQSARAKFSDLLSQRNAAFASVKEVWSYIKEIKICTVELSMPDIEQVLETLVYDGTAEKRITGSGDPQYKAADSVLDSTAMVRLPCGVCPVVEQCHEGGTVSPSTCPYMEDWLSF